MKYKLHRVAPNSELWIRPSGGRLDRSGVGDYVARNGFGHEDWNFNLDFAIDGQVLGYTVAHPPQKYAGDTFGLVLATYEDGRWSMAGYYEEAVYLKEPARPSEQALEQMAADVYELALASQVASSFRSMTFEKIKDTLRRDFVHYRWSARKSQVVAFEHPVSIPKGIFDPGAQRMMTSFNLAMSQFNAITKLGTSNLQVRHSNFSENDFLATEGERILKVHSILERDATLVRKFKKNLKSLACVVCGFDFQEIYGPRGEGYIECHHVKPVASMKPGEKTSTRDLRAVCSNCHRMLHKTPMLSIEELRQMITRAR